TRALGPTHPLLQEPLQRGLQIAVAKNVVRDLVENVVGVEIPKRLGTIPARIAVEHRQPRYRACPGCESLFSFLLRCRPSRTSLPRTLSSLVSPSVSSSILPAVEATSAPRSLTRGAASVSPSRMARLSALETRFS